MDVQRWRVLRTWLFAGVTVLGCQTAENAPSSTENSTGAEFSIVFAGDTILARSVNSLVSEHGTNWPLEDIADELSAADLAVVNLECVLAAGGRHDRLDVFDKSYLRGRPELVGVLHNAGVDVVSMANNHGGDYGPDALLESIQVLQNAGIDVAGAGHNSEAAAAPVFRRVGATVVGFISAHTMTKSSAAQPQRPGTNYLALGNLDQAVERVRAQVHRARRYAHLVVLLIHWGPNGRSTPRKSHRTLATRLVREAGIDALVGTSAHVLQGIELIDGVPIIYDAGNLVVDWHAPKRWTHRSAVFQLRGTQSGIHRIEIKPLKLSHARSEWADRKLGRRILTRMGELSAALGTSLKIDANVATIDIKRAHAAQAPRQTYPRAAPKSASLREIHLPTLGSHPPAVRPATLPVEAQRSVVQFQGGIKLLGYKLPKRRTLRLGLNITTYWQTDRTLNESYEIEFEIVPLRGEQAPDVRWKKSLHQPADWMYPTTAWKVGEIVEDTFHVGRRGTVQQTTVFDVRVALRLGDQRVAVQTPGLDHPGAPAPTSVSLGHVVFE